MVEADAMAAELARAGIDPGRVVRERRSLSTRGNAWHVANLLGAGAAGDGAGVAASGGASGGGGEGRPCIAVVTCDWHLPRARRLFEARGFDVRGVPAASGPASLPTRLWRWGRERVAGTLDRL